MAGTPQPLQLEVLGLQLAAQRWHPGGIPVIALHGWLDNSESFAALAPRMPAIDLLALDMAGHGWSDHRAAHASYLIWDDIREILAVADTMGWQRFGLLGHSRGAIIAALMAAVLPERITAAGLIDGFWAQTTPAAQAPAQMQRSLASRPRPPDTVFASLDAMVAPRLRHGFPLGEAACRRLVARNARQCDDGTWQWRTDVRHRQPSLVMLTPEQQEAFHRAIAVPVELALASDGLALAYPDHAERLWQLPQVSWSLHEGGHHLHMEGGESILGPLFNRFFQRL